jgi:hypothetical protein
VITTVVVVPVWEVVTVHLSVDAEVTVTAFPEVDDNVLVMVGSDDKSPED